MNISDLNEYLSRTNDLHTILNKMNYEQKNHLLKEL